MALIIGLGLAALTTLMLGADSFADGGGSGDDGNTYIRVYTGLDSKRGLHGAGGDLPDTRIYDILGDELGHVYDPGEFVSSGTHADYWIGHDLGQRGRQAMYSLFTGNKNAICIAYATITWAGETGRSGALLGDFGRQCSKRENSWYYSNVVIPGSNPLHVPYCLWLDWDDDHPNRIDHPITAVQVNWADMMTNSNDYRAGRNISDLGYDICDSPTYKLYTKQDYKDKILVWNAEGGPEQMPPWMRPEWNGEGQSSDAITAVGGQQPDQGSMSPLPAVPPPVWKFNKHRRDVRERGAARRLTQRKPTVTEANRDKVVISDRSEHTASELCADFRSGGPSFVNPVEGLFCRMTDRALFPVCGAEDEQNGTACFDMDLKKIVNEQGSHMERTAPYEADDWRVSPAESYM